MFNPKRLWMVLSSALTLGVAGVLVLAGTAPGASALRTAANNLTVTAHAAGSGGGGMSITILPTASLTARLAATTLVSYTCQPVNGGETFLAASVFVQVSERTSGKTVAQGSGASSGFAICDGGTINTASVVVIPGGYFTSPPFKKGTALVTASGNACSSAVTSGGYQACDFGSAGPTIVSIK